MIQAYINGVAYDMLMDYSISEQLGNKTSTSLSVLVPIGKPFPRSGDIIEVKDENNTYFLGTCGIPKSPEFESENTIRVYSITCGNANSILSRRLANVAYRGHTITEIVQALYDQYISAEGFALGGISDIPVTLDTYTAADYGLQNCLDELASLVEGVWYCSNDRKFYFVAKEEFESFPQVISPSFVPINGIQKTTKDTDLRTSQIIKGGTEQTDEQTENYLWTEDQNNFTVNFPVAQRPTISVNGTPLPASAVGVSGLNEDDPSVVFLFSYNSQIIKYNDENTVKTIAANDVITVQYIGMYPIRVVVDNAVEIEELANRTGTSGRIENVKIDATVTSISDATSMGQGLLSNYGQVRGEISCWVILSVWETYGLTVADLGLGKKWRFELPDYDMTGEYVLTERSISPLGPDDLQFELKLVDRAYLRSYAQALSDLSKDVSQLSIREDDVVINTQAISETEYLYEQYTIAENTDFVPIYCTSEEDFAENGQLVSPVALSLYAFDMGG